MTPSAALAPALLARARADQVAQLYASWSRSSLSTVLGAGLLCFVLWGQAAPGWLAVWGALIVGNQAWRGVLAQAWERQRPGIDAARRWGRYWSAGSTLSGGLFGLASLAMYPPSAPHQALLIVCLFGVVMGGLNINTIYRPTLYCFTLPALVPLIIRIALEGDQVHLETALVMVVVLVFILAFGHQLNNVLTRTLAMRYENLELIEELKGNSRAAHDARTAAEAANRAKSQLLAAASHDLRQPLHALGLYTAALAARATEAQWRPLVGNVQRAVAALEGQFEQLLDLSRLEAGAMHPASVRVALAPLLARVQAELQPQAEAKGLALRIAPTRHAVRSDPVLLERVVRNLVANAVRYTEAGGVLIGTRLRGRDVAIDVVDTGIGIPPEHRARIFEEFYQVRQTRSSRAHAGMGLGLAIVRRIAALLSHRVEVDSRVGRGSRFRVLAPHSAGASERLVPLLHRQRIAAPHGGPASMEGALVAVIDEDPAAVDAMTALFETWGAAVVGAGDALALLDAIGDAERYPDLIVADLRLACGESGIAVVHKLRDELGIALPALLVSGDTSPAAERDARIAGLTLLGKPVVAVVLQAMVTALIARA
ncbi:MAG: hybrid sensor histidine kinase/response regulator [Casimicrobiaceae bacterium]